MGFAKNFGEAVGGLERAANTEAMSTPSPFLPQGSFLERQQVQKRARFKVLLFVVLVLHVDQLYTVKSGDTLTKIAQAHGTTIKAIRALNQLTSDQLIVGKTLKLPEPSATSSNTPPRT